MTPKNATRGIEKASFYAYLYTLPRLFSTPSQGQENHKFCGYLFELRNFLTARIMEG
jgi:hypothetical protein